MPAGRSEGRAASASRVPEPVVVNLSSSLGSFWAVTNPERRELHNSFVVYGASKAAVSMLTVQYAKAPGLSLSVRICPRKR